MSRLCFYTNPWGSGEIRGRQIAEALGSDIAVVNPPNLRTDDIFIGIKILPPPAVIGKIRACYIDVVDCHGTIPVIQKDDRLTAIAISGIAYDYLCSKIPSERVVKIPEHHCNFERGIRQTHFPIKTLGYIGELSGLHLVPRFLGNALQELGIDFLAAYRYSCRQDVLDFYGEIDLQLAFRLDDKDGRVFGELKNPLKLNNAGSCGIPTIAWPEANYLSEWKGGFWEAKSIEDIVSIIENMTLESYKSMAYQALGRAEYYHIERILPLYMELLER